MTAIDSSHRDLGATFGERADLQVVEHYGRPERAHRAVRNAVGVTEGTVGVIEVTGDDRLEYVDNVVSNRVPPEDGHGCYALVLDPQGHVETQLFIFNAGERLLCVLPPERAEPLATEWAEKVFIQDVAIRDRSEDFATFFVCGPQATERVASVLSTAPPDDHFSFTRGHLGDCGVTVARMDAPVGEETYAVVSARADADRVFDTLLNARGNAAPFGRQTWETLTLEAGTVSFEHETRGRIPNELGLRTALDFEKGCYVGQEVVSRIENRGRPPNRLVGFVVESDRTPGPDAAVFDGDAAVGAVTRAAVSPVLEEPIALALVDFDVDAEAVRVRVEGEDVPARRVALPFVEGSERSGRLPQYPTV